MNQSATHNREYFHKDPVAAYEYPGGLYHLKYGSGKDKTMPWARYDDMLQCFYKTNGEKIPDAPYIRKPQDPIAPVIIVVEGEKDVENVAEHLHLEALSGNKGGEKWCEEYSKPLKGKDVIIVPDNDITGRSYAEKALTSAEPIAKSIRILNLPELWEDIEEKEDISDAIQKHGAEEVLDALLHFYQSMKDQGIPEKEPDPSEEDLKAPMWLPVNFLQINKQTFDSIDKMPPEVRREIAAGFVHYCSTGKKILSFTDLPPVLEDVALGILESIYPVVDDACLKSKRYSTRQRNRRLKDTTTDNHG